MTSIGTIYFTLFRSLFTLFQGFPLYSAVTAIENWERNWIKKKESLKAWQQSGILARNGLKNTLREKCLYSEFYWPVFSCIWTECGEIRVSRRIQSECGKIGTRKSPNTDTFHTMIFTIQGVFTCKLDETHPWTRFHHRVKLFVFKLFPFLERFFFQY